MAVGSLENDRDTFIPVLITNLLPLGGIVLLGWQPEEVLSVYWVEIGLFIAIHSGLALFAAREPDDRQFTPPTLAIPFLCPGLARYSYLIGSHRSLVEIFDILSACSFGGLVSGFCLGR